MMASDSLTIGTKQVTLMAGSLREVNFLACQATWFPGTLSAETTHPCSESGI